MNRITFSISIVFTCFSMFAQQIGNSNMESWENVGQTTEEPTNWNSFMTASGSLALLGSKQVQQSTSIRSGSAGSYCARIWSVSTFGIVANGNLTLGQINMGSSTPASTSNYNFSKTSDPNHSEAITVAADSLVFWVKFTPASGSPNARVHAVLHDNYELRDPVDANSTSHVISRAELNYPSTGGQWVRKSVPFVNQGPATSPQFLLITFTTNQTPGGGSANDEVLIDDIELIYNSTSQIEEKLPKATFNASYNELSGLYINSEKEIIHILNSSGSVVKIGTSHQLNGTVLNSGLYFLKSSSETIKILVP